MRLPGLRALAALCAPAAVIGVGLLAPGTAAAEETAPDAGALTAETALTGVSPGVLTPDVDAITLTGTVRNTGDEPMSNVQALPRFSTNRVESRDEIRAIGTDEELYWGSRDSDGFDLLAATLEPGQAADFTVTISSEQLGFDANGVYVVGVDVLASPLDSTDRARFTSRTVVPWIQNPEELPSVPVAVLWPLAARPALLPDGSLTDETLAEQLGPDEPLSALLDAGAEAPVTWAVDPTSSTPCPSCPTATASSRPRAPSTARRPTPTPPWPGANGSTRSPRTTTSGRCRTRCPTSVRSTSTTPPWPAR